MIKCVSVTKWILYRSDPTQFLHRVRKDTNISRLADYTLATLGYQSFKDYEPYVALLARSEIMHRIPVMDEKPFAACRCLPAETPRFRVVTNQHWINHNQLADSDIHFDYFKMRLITAEAIAYSVGQVPHFNQLYRVKLNSLTRDVQFDFVSDNIIPLDKQFIFEDSLSSIPLPKSKIRWLSENLEQISSGEYLPFMPKNAEVAGAMGSSLDLAKVLVIDHYRTLKMQNLWDFNLLWGDTAWKPFLKKYGVLIDGETSEKMETIRKILEDDRKSRFEQIRSSPYISIDNIALSVVVEAMRTGDLLAEDEAEQAAEKIRALAETALRTKNNMKEALELLRGTTESMQLLRRKVIGVSFRDVLLETALVVKQVKGQIVVDIASSRYILLSMIEDIAAMAKPQSSLGLILALIVSYLDREVLLDAAEELFQLAKHTVENGDIELSVPDSVLVKTSVEDIDPDTDPDPVESLELSSRIIAFDATDASMLTKVQKAIEYRQRICQQYGDPSVTASPYGSDIYQCAKSTFSELKRLGCLSSGARVFDATAGRGECRMALEELNIPVVSYNRKDPYSLVRHYGGINYIDDYDVASDYLRPEISAFCINSQDTGSMVLYDVSHLGALQSAFSDRMLDTLAVADMCMVRYAAISKNLKVISENSYKLGFRSYLITVQSGSCASPTIYVLYSKSGKWSKKLPTPAEHRMSANYLMMEAISVLKAGVNSRFDHGPRYNSVIENLGGYGTAVINLEEKIEAVVRGSQSKYVITLSSNMKAMNVAPIYRRLKTKLIELGCREGIHVYERVGNWNQFFEEFEIMRTREEETKFSSSDDDIDVIWVDLSAIDNSILRVLRKFHHSSRWRRICQALLMTDVLDLKLLGEKNSDYYGRTWESNVPTGRRENQRTQSLGDALVLLAVDAIARNSLLHQKVLAKALATSAINSKKARELQHFRRLMSCLYEPMCRLLNRKTFSAKLSERLQNYALDRFVKQGRYISVKTYTAEIQREETEGVNRAMSKSNLEMAEAFNDNIDSLLDFDVIGARLIVNTNLTVDSSDLGEITLHTSIGSGGMDALSLESEFNDLSVPDDIVMQESVITGELMDGLLVIEGETEEERQARAEVLAQYALMMSDY